MALIEGGAFHCYIHDYETTRIDEWNEHCTASEHTESGHTLCTVCKERVYFSNLPFQPLAPDGTKGIALKCEDCESKSVGKVRRSKDDPLLATTTSAGTNSLGEKSGIAGRQQKK